MGTPPEMLERRIDELRVAIRQAVAAGDRVRSRKLRAELRAAERAWDEAVGGLERESAHAGTASARAASPGPDEAAAAHAEAGYGGTPRATAAAGGDPASANVAAGLGEGAPAIEGAGEDGSARAGQLLPIREQVHQVLTLIGVPAAPRLIVAVHEAFFSGPLVAARLTSLRRDEERSFRAAPYARAYYICAALTADLLGPMRGLLVVSTWPLDRRVIGPLSPRVDYLMAAIRVAEGVRRLEDPGSGALRLLWRFALNIPGASAGARPADADRVARAARAELDVHEERDTAHRKAAASRAAAQLDDTGQLFGYRMRVAPPRSLPGA